MTRRKGKARRRAGQGALLAIFLLFVGSGLTRLGAGTGLAIAREVEGIAAATGPAESPARDACPPPPDIAKLMRAFQTREKKLSARERDQERRERSLDLARKEIESQLAALKQAETRLKATLAQADGAAEDDVARLVAVYENMKPEQASALFEEMAPDFAAGFLGRMRPEAAAEIMAGLSSQAAYSISVILASRNMNVPTR